MTKRCFMTKGSALERWLTGIFCLALVAGFLTFKPATPLSSTMIDIIQHERATAVPLLSLLMQELPGDDHADLAAQLLLLPTLARILRRHVPLALAGQSRHLCTWIPVIASVSSMDNSQYPSETLQTACTPLQIS